MHKAFLFLQAKYFIMKKVLFYFLIAIEIVQAQNANLVPRAAFSGTTRLDAVAFSISGKGYIGTGDLSLGLTSSDDFWEYDPVLDVWSQKASFAGGMRDNAVGFSINNKGYIGTGHSYQAGLLYNDLWEYDPIVNNWIQKSNFPGTPRLASIAFVINNIAFVGMGQDFQAPNYFNDLWSYDAMTDTWQQKTSLPGSGRSEAFSFSIGTNGYVGGGMNEMDFYEYNSLSDSWVQKNNIPNVGATTNFFFGATGFLIGNKGYFFGGYGLIYPLCATTLQEYDVATDTWSIIYNSSGPPYYNYRMAGVSIFIINGVPFITQGVDSGNGFYPELSQVNITTDISENSFSNQITISPNPPTTEFQISNFQFQTGDKITLTDVLGKTLFTKEITSPSVNCKLQTVNFSNGIYFLQLKTKEGVMSKRVVVQR